MWILMRDCLMVVLLWVAVGTPTHLAFEQTNPCATGEQPCDPDRPWMRGTVEKSCARGEVLAKLREENPNILACACQHTCDPKYDHAKDTESRRWDGRCEARCNPKNCQCPHPCDE